MATPRDFVPFLQVLIHALKGEYEDRKFYVKIITNNKKYRTTARYDKNWMQFFILSLPRNKKLQIEIWEEKALSNTKLTYFSIDCHDLIIGKASFFDEEVETQFGLLKIQIIPILTKKRMLKVVDKLIIEAIEEAQVQFQEPDYSYYPAPSILGSNQKFISIDGEGEADPDADMSLKYHSAPEIMGVVYENNYDHEKVNGESNWIENEYDTKNYDLQGGLDEIYDNLGDDDDKDYEGPIIDNLNGEEDDDDIDSSIYATPPLVTDKHKLLNNSDFEPQIGGLFFLKNKKLEDLDVYIYPIVHEDYEWVLDPISYRPISHLKGSYWYKNALGSPTTA